MTRKNIASIAAVIAAFALGLAYFGLVFAFAVDIPKTDDFDMYLRFLLTFTASPNLWDKLKLIISHHGEHVIALTRLTALTAFYLSGELDFREIILLGNAAVPVSLFFLWRMLPPGKNSVMFLPVVLLMFQPSFVEVMIWAAGAIEHLWVMPLVLGAFYFHLRAGAFYFAAAVIFSLLASLTQGNGLFCPMLISLSCLSAARWGRGVFFAALTALLSLLHLGSVNLHLLERSTDARLIDYLNYSLSFLGCWPGLRVHEAALVLGGLLIGAAIGLGVPGWWKKSPASYGLLLFVILTAAANSLARIQFGISSAYLTSRYTYPSVFACIAVYLAVLEICGVRRIRSLVIGLAMIGSLAGCGYWYWVNLDQFVFRKELLEESVARWQIAGSGLEYPDQSASARLIRQAKEKGIYRLPRVNIENYKRRVSPLLMPASGKQAMVHKLEELAIGDEFVFMRGFAFPRKEPFCLAESAVILKGNAAAYRVPAVPRTRPDVSLHHGRRDLNPSGFLVVFARREIEPGEYRIGISMCSCSGASYQKMFSRHVKL